MDDPRFTTPARRVRHRAELEALLEPCFRTAPSVWLERMEAAGVPAGPILGYDEVADPHVQRREMAVEVQHPRAGATRVLGIPVNLSRTPGAIRRPAPVLGEQTDEVLRELGYDERAIRALHDGKVVSRGTVYPMTPADPAARPGLPRTILVIEDNLDAREALVALLELEGYVVEGAEDGPRGLEIARAKNPDVVLIDIGLPGLDGYEVARHMRAMPGRRMSLVALTGYGQPEDRKRALEAGFDAHLVKPVDPSALTDLLNRETPGPGSRE